MKKLILLLVASLALVSCVSKKKYLTLMDQQKRLELSLQQKEESLEICTAEKTELGRDLSETKNLLLTARTSLSNEQSKYAAMEKQLEYLQSTNTDLLDRLADLSVVSKAGAENIRKSLETLQDQNKYIRDLTGSVQKKDSLNLILVMNLKRSLADVNDEDVQIEVKKGVVYISLSDKMLFRSGSAVINPEAERVLGKIAKVINNHEQLEILVEGHTDSVPIRTDCLTDNWDLSVKRATSVVRMLQEKYNVRPDRMTAGGRSEFLPKASNQTEEGRSLNRRTEIIILPKLDEFFQLLEPPSAGK